MLYIFPGVVYVIGSSLVGYGENTYSINKRYYGAAMMEWYTKLLKLIPEIGETYYKIVTSYYNVLKDKQSIGTDGITNITTGNKNRVYKAIENFKKGLELGENYKAYTKNLSMLINSYVSLGESDEALSICNSNMGNKEFGNLYLEILCNYGDIKISQIA